MKPRLTPRVQAATAVGLVVGALAAVFVPKMFSVEPAFATQGTGFMRRRSSPEVRSATTWLSWTPTQLVVKRKVRIKTRRGFVTKTIRIKVPSIDKAITCTDAVPCDTVFQQGTLQPGGSTGWHTHPGPAFIAFAQGEGTYYHDAGSACHALTVTAGTGFSQMPSRDARSAEPGLGAGHRLHAVCPASRDAQLGDQDRPAAAVGLPGYPLTGVRAESSRRRQLRAFP